MGVILMLHMATPTRPGFILNPQPVPMFLLAALMGGFGHERVDECMLHVTRNDEGLFQSKLWTDYVNVGV
jgi:hypothetical protein